jgi:hypothetical protein
MDAVDVMCKGCGKCVECGWQIGEFDTKGDSFRREASAAMVAQGSPVKWRDVAECEIGSVYGALTRFVLRHATQDLRVQE